MGRGRAKAKQTKVARELKYRSVDTDLASLQRELGSNHLDDDVYEDTYAAEDDADDVDDPYADLASRYEIDDDDEDVRATS